MSRNRTDSLVLHGRYGIDGWDGMSGREVVIEHGLILKVKDCGISSRLPHKDSLRSSPHSQSMYFGHVHASYFKGHVMTWEKRGGAVCGLGGHR